MNLLPIPFHKLFHRKTCLTPAAAEKIGMLYEAGRTIGEYPLRTFLLNSVQRNVKADLVQCDRILRSLRRHVDVAERIVLDLLHYDLSLAQDIFSQILFADELALVAKLWSLHCTDQEPVRHRPDREEALCRSIDEAIASGATAADPAAVMNDFDLVREPHGKDWALRERNAAPGSGGKILIAEPQYSVDAQEFILYAFDRSDRDWRSVRFRTDGEGRGVAPATGAPLPFSLQCVVPGRMNVGVTSYELHPEGEITAYIFPERYRPLATLVRAGEDGAWRTEHHDKHWSEDDAIAEIVRDLMERGCTENKVVVAECACRISVRTAVDDGIGQLTSVQVKRCFETYAVHATGSRRLLFRRFGL